MESDLLEMLATETDRRAPAIIEGIRERSGASEPDAARIEEVRVEIHGLKGAAMVVGQTRLAALAVQIEINIVQQVAKGVIAPELADTIVTAVNAFQEGARAAAAGEPEPPSIETSLAALQTDT
ncbi:MAG: Hpt domain-containing protein [Actinomycetota bacterium]|nr:Hpt domain-containing protein [Actinomycetota bacterium]